MADLLRAIPLPVAMDFMGVSSYGSGTRSSGVVRLTADLSLSIEGRDVIIVEDIIDTGRTSATCGATWRPATPGACALCVLLDKVDRREVDVDVDYVGFAIPDEFVVGYGFDYDGWHRNLPDLAVLEPVSAPRDPRSGRPARPSRPYGMIPRMNPFYKNLALWMVIGLIVILLFNALPGRTSRLARRDRLLRLPEEGRDRGSPGGHAPGQHRHRPAERRLVVPDLHRRLPGPGQVAQGPGRQDRRQAAGQQPGTPSCCSGCPMLLFIGVWIFFMRQMQGGRRQGAVLRQGARPADLGEAEQGHVPGRGGRGRGQGRAARDHRVPEGSAQVPEARRQDPEGRAAGRALPAPARRCWPRPSRARPTCRSSRSPARTSSRCSSAWAPRACATSSSRARSTRPASSSWTRSTRSAGTGARAWAAATTSASRP